MHDLSAHISQFSKRLVSWIISDTQRLASEMDVKISATVRFISLRYM